MTDRRLADGKTAPWAPAAWQSYRLKRVVWSTFAGETQALADGLGHTERLACHLGELIGGEVNLKRRQDMLARFNIQAIVDCESVYDHLQAFTSPNSVSDKRVAIDLVIIRETLQRLNAN